MADMKKNAAGGASKSTQNTQYDQIGNRYNDVKKEPATKPEIPSLMAVLKEVGVEGKRCLDLACGTGLYTAILSSLGATHIAGYDISSSMVEAAQTAYPSSTHPNIHFGVKDCSLLSAMQHDEKFDIVFASWFLNYAGSERELTDMFRVIAQNLAPGGRFVGLTTNMDDRALTEPRLDFYGFDILVPDKNYVAPDTGREVGITARIVLPGQFSFDVFQFRRDVYERCAKEAGLAFKSHGVVLPDEPSNDGGYWDKFLDRPTFIVLDGWVAEE